MKFHQRIAPVNYAGYIAIQQEGTGYGEDDLLDQKEYPHAEAFSEELCRRWNKFESLERDIKLLLDIGVAHELGKLILSNTIKKYYYCRASLTSFRIKDTLTPTRQAKNLMRSMNF